MKLAFRDVDLNTTNEGIMVPIYRDWDSMIQNYKPAMVYATTMLPNTAKGPILHEKRSGYLTSLGGNLSIEYFEDNVLKCLSLSEDKNKARVVTVPPNVPVKFINSSNTEAVTIINLPDVAWHPDNKDTIKFQNWEDFFSYVKK